MDKNKAAYRAGLATDSFRVEVRGNKRVCGALAAVVTTPEGRGKEEMEMREMNGEEEAVEEGGRGASGFATVEVARQLLPRRWPCVALLLLLLLHMRDTREGRNESLGRTAGVAEECLAKGGVQLSDHPSPPFSDEGNASGGSIRGGETTL